MAIEKLYRIRIMGLQQDKEKVVDFLQRNGMVHISSGDDIEKIDEVKRDSPIEKIEEVSSRLLELRWITEHLSEYYIGPELYPEFSDNDVSDILRKAEYLKQELYDDMAKLVEGIGRNSEKIAEVETSIEKLKDIPFKDIHKIMSCKPAMFKEAEENQCIDDDITSVMLVKDMEYTQKNTDNIKAFIKQFRKSATIVLKNDYILVNCLKKDKTCIIDYLSDHNLELIGLPDVRNDLDLEIIHLNKEIIDMKNDITIAESKLSKIANEYYDISIATQHDLSVLHNRYSAPQSFLKTVHTFIMEGYIPVSAYAKFTEIEKIAGVHLAIEDVKEAGPIKLKNNSYSRHFEFIVEMFGLPRYEGFDPTFFISIFLPFFFGFMFSDIGYGTMLLLGAIYIMKKHSKRSRSFKDAGIVMITCAISTIIFGIFFGAFFGNLIKITPLLLDPFSNAKIVLVIALVLGLLHINLGIFISMYENIKKKDLKSLIYNNFSILFFQISIGFLAIGNQTLGYGLLVISIILMILKSKLMGIMDITGFAGTWFSYARLLALSLATGGIALGINIIAEQLLSINMIGPVLFIIVLIVGHLFNFAMNLLGSSIHAVRLHYIEFFSQFYEADGKPFEAFSTRLKEGNP